MTGTGHNGGPPLDDGELASFDTETRSAIDLKRGVHKYVEHPSTGVWCMRWRIGAGPRIGWRPGYPAPEAFLAHIRAGRRVKAHNMQFDRNVWNEIIVKRLHPDWPTISIEQCECSMAQAAAMALPQAIDKLGAAIGAAVQKDQEGKALMRRMCRPRRIEDDGRIVWWDEPDKVDRLDAYCDTDVASETAIGEKLFPLSTQELRVYRLDQTINERGVRIDVRLVERALEAVEEALRRANYRMKQLTEGAVSKCSEAAKIVTWLQGRGIQCESVAKGEVEEIIIRSQLFGDAVAEEVITLRRAAAKSSTAKFKTMIACACADMRVRGTLAYHGASTGRWAGRLIQPQNFKRIGDLDRVMSVIGILLRGTSRTEVVDILELMFGQPMEVLSEIMRAAICAAPGKKLVGGDFSNIEGRIGAWLAGETWKIQAFRDFDAGSGPDLYKLTASNILGKPVESITKDERQGYGKVPELACLYQGSVGAFQTMGANLGVNVSDEQALTIVQGYRAANPAIVKSWWELQDAALEAVSFPGMKVPALGGKVHYLTANGFLFCRLPSGRVLCYASPKIVRTTITTRDGRTMEKNAVEYWGVDSKTRKWSPQRLYGGLQFENIDQAIARDIMVESMFAAEEAGYPIILTVHDELLCEVDDNASFSSTALEKIMSRLPAWADGLPLAAAAWEDYRYVK